MVMVVAGTVRMSAWCELRNGYRNFRVERIQSSTVFNEPSDQDNGRLFRELAELPKVKPSPSP
jgi:predicted DNA-binding transcriptional regulator YafY